MPVRARVGGTLALDLSNPGDDVSCVFPDRFREAAGGSGNVFQMRRWPFRAVGVPFFAQGAGIGAAVHAGRAVDALVAVGVGIAASREAWFRRCSLAMLA